jgi:hypothetical protein
MKDAKNPLRLRIDASKLLAEHGWGKPASVDLAAGAAGEHPDGAHEGRQKLAVTWEEFDAELDRLAAAG